MIVENEWQTIPLNAEVVQFDAGAYGRMDRSTIR